MNRACQVHTTGFDLPDRRMISAVPQPSAVARITLARHTCFCGAQRSATIASSRRRSPRVTLTTIPPPPLHDGGGPDHRRRRRQEAEPRAREAGRRAYAHREPVATLRDLVYTR